MHCRDTVAVRRKIVDADAVAADGRDAAEVEASSVEFVAVETFAEAKALVANDLKQCIDVEQNSMPCSAMTYSFHNKGDVVDFDSFAFASEELAVDAVGDGAAAAVEAQRVDLVATDWCACLNNVWVVRNSALQLKDLNPDLHRHHLVFVLVPVLGFDCLKSLDFHPDDEVVRHSDLDVADVLVAVVVSLPVDFDLDPLHSVRIVAAAIAVRLNSVVVVVHWVRHLSVQLSVGSGCW